MKKFDYAIRLQGGSAGQEWMFTPMTDRAKERTPQPLKFANRQEALAFLQDSQAQGYQFSGAERVDPEQKRLKNRYFVIGSDGQLRPAGEDSGPCHTLWEVGDVRSPSGGDPRTEAVIEAILQGPGARERFGCDIAFPLRVHRVQAPFAARIPPFDPAKPCPCGLHAKHYGACCQDKGPHALGNQMLRRTAPRMVPGALAEIQSSMVKGETRLRLVRNTLWPRPQAEPFDQFLDALAGC